MPSKKLLTISVAAYNVEKYLAQTLESLIVPSLMESIEVLIVSDGSTDSTCSIASKYVRQYPYTFKLVEKENGGYGTTVNAALKMATGEFFRLLDGDDWIHGAGLEDLVSHLAKVEADVYLTPRFIVRDGETEREVENYPWKTLTGKVFGPAELNFADQIGMWVITARTEMLRSHPFELPAHTLYTDQLFTVHALAYAKRFSGTAVGLYCYRVGREGQSVSRESRLRHIDDQWRSTRMVLEFVENTRDIDGDNRTMLERRAARYYNLYIKTLMLGPASWATWRTIKALDREIADKFPAIYSLACTPKFSLVRRAGHLGYWPCALRGVSNWE